MLLLSGARLECVSPPRDMEMSPIITTGPQLSQPSILHSKASDCNSDILHMCNVVFVVGIAQLIKGLCSPLVLALFSSQKHLLDLERG